MEAPTAQAGNQQTPNLPKSGGSHVIAFAIGDAKTFVNDTTGQVALAKVPQERGTDSEGSPDKSTGTAPYTKQQVAQGAEAYARECAVCRGAQLQGVSAPALTGPSFGRSHLTAEQLRSVVVQQMPLTGARLTQARRVRPDHGVSPDLRSRAAGKRRAAALPERGSSHIAAGPAG